MTLCHRAQSATSWASILSKPRAAVFSHPLNLESHPAESDGQGVCLFDEGVQLASRVRAPDGKIMTTPFLEVCRTCLVIVGKMVRNPGYAMLKFDVDRNMRRIAARAAINPSAYEGDMLQMVLDDVAENGSSAVSAVSLLWLKRSMEFGLAGLLNLAGDPDTSLHQAACDAYRDTLQDYHTWVLTNVFIVAMRLVYGRQLFLRNLGVPEGDELAEEAAMRRVEAFCTAFGQVLVEINDFLVLHGLDNPCKVSERGP